MKGITEMNQPKRLGDLQYAIMRVLWTEGECTVAQVHKALEKDRGLAPTTIATMLQKMDKKGVVTYRREGRRFIYRPTVSEPEVRTSMVQELTHRLFDGDATALVSHLLAEHEIEAGELEQLQHLIAQRQEEEDR